jgi:two-component system chemotaxis response regulator CheY
MTDKNIKILIVDDFATLRMSLISILEQLGYSEIDEAADGQEAVGKLKEKNYDLIMSDIDMPVMNGFELLDYIRKDDNLRNTPVMFITAEAEREKIVEAIKAGLNAYITKPFSISTLQQKIENIFNPEQ